MKFTLNGTHPKVTNLNRLSKRNAMGDQIDLNKQSKCQQDNGVSSFSY